MKLQKYFEANPGLTQKKFGDQIGVAVSTVSKYVHGHLIPNPDTMRRIVEVTDGKVRPGDFYDLGGKGEEKSRQTEKAV